MPSYLWSMTSPRHIGWVQAGDVWALRVLYFYVCSKLVYCSCACCDLETCLHILPVILGFLWHGLFANLIFSTPLLPLGLGFAGLWASFSLAYPFTLSVALPLFPAISLCYSCCDVIGSKPGGPLWTCYLWLSIVIWAFSIVLLAAPVSHLFSLRHPWPICFA